MSWFDRLRRRKPPSERGASWTRLPEELVEPFVATVALAVMEAAPDERSDVNAMTGTIRLPDRGLKLELRDLAERCRSVEPDKWGPIIAEQVARWVVIPGPVPTTFAEAAPLIRIQLTNHTPIDSALCAREISTGLVGELCFDAPGARIRITRAVAAGWGRSDDELWERGIENLSGEGVVVESFELTDPVQLVFHHAHGDHELVASLALRLPALGDPAEHGWLFMVPHGGSLWYAPLHQLEQCAAGMMMFAMAVPELRDALPISGAVYWTDGTQFATISRKDARTGFELTEVITAEVRRLVHA